MPAPTQALTLTLTLTLKLRLQLPLVRAPVRRREGVWRMRRESQEIPPKERGEFMESRCTVAVAVAAGHGWDLGCETRRGSLDSVGLLKMSGG